MRSSKIAQLEEMAVRCRQRMLEQRLGGAQRNGVRWRQPLTLIVDRGCFGTAESLLYLSLVQDPYSLAGMWCSIQDLSSKGGERASGRSAQLQKHVGPPLDGGSQGESPDFLRLRGEQGIQQGNCLVERLRLKASYARLLDGERMQGKLQLQLQLNRAAGVERFEMLTGRSGPIFPLKKFDRCRPSPRRASGNGHPAKSLHVNRKRSRSRRLRS